MKKFLSTIWNALAQKGKFTTLIGLTIIIWSVVKPLVQHNKGVVFEEGYLWQMIYFILAGIILIILPSKLSIKGLKTEFIIED